LAGCDVEQLADEVQMELHQGKQVCRAKQVVDLYVLHQDCP